ncbi:GNAT family N-acetyltransferase [Nostoc sp. 'Peltigera malacea cyanobiont' DB3992]|uniref:GNAT family N-acetyltransferase n=1 Tax=Nostoc sp. 'Peltigera malacea cyanobiont' DB3992 TaxID=1206980 RepID=UPI00211EC3CD|nr:GNAT family N-acetyltransferase [Nostoc sp. 'Peltigera malacea cyanobiont' DB3992]
MACEAAKASLRYGFEEVKLDRIVAITAPEHTASRRVMEKCGLKYQKNAQFLQLRCSVLSSGSFLNGDQMILFTFCNIKTISPLARNVVTAVENTCFKSLVGAYSCAIVLENLC